MDVVEKFGKPVKGSIPTIVRAYKSAVTYAVNGAQNIRGAIFRKLSPPERADEYVKDVEEMVLKLKANAQ
jgi:hypothetical protein